MKISNFLIILLAFVVMFAIACNNSSKEDATTEAGTETVESQDPNAAAINVSNEKHYTCPNKCEGSGGDAKGTCPVCGAEYVHNAAYHSQNPGAEGTSPENPIQIDPNAGATNQPAAPTSATPVEPPAAQNAAGEWHFACSKSCGGGGGSQGACPKCGAELVHNQAYHNK